MKQLRFLLILAVFAISLPLQTIPSHAFPVSSWSKIYEGVECATGYTTSPRLMRAFALRVTLRNPDVWTAVSHDNGGSPYEVTLQGTDAYMYEHGLKLAVNGNFWDVATSPNVDVLGLAITGGVVVSPAQANYGWLAFTGDKIPEMSLSPYTPSGKWTAVGGSFPVLSEGQIITSDTTINPYTGYGISQDGKLIMVVVDGRQSAWSNGCSVVELAQWLKDFGSWWGIRMDGGGSSCMARADVGVWNHPCYGYVRPVATSFGIFSVPGTWVGPGSCCMNTNRTDIVVRGQWDEVYLKTWTSSGGWAAPVDLGGSTIKDPAIVSVADGRLDVVIVDKNTNNYQMKTWTSAGGWTGWTNLGSLWSDGPSLARRDSTHFDIVGRSIYGDLYHNVYNTANGTWEGWNSIGMNTYYPAGIAVQGNGCCCIFVRSDQDGSVIMRWGNGSTWYSWGLGNWVNGRPAAVCRGGNKLDVFVRGGDGSIQHRGCDDNVVWGNWESLGGNIGNISVCAQNANQINTYHRGTDDYLWQKTWTSTGGWGGFGSPGPYFP